MDPLERARVRASVRGGLFGDAIDAPRVGPYEIRGRLGAGAMGVVYEAWDPRLRRSIALKMLHVETGDEQHAQRLLREAQALAQLRHPNVVAVHDVGTDDGRVYVVMDRVDGETLSDWASRVKPSVSELLAVLAAVGRGLQAAHASGLIHRDVKPDNVLVSKDGVPHLVDFGLVRRIDTDIAVSLRHQHSGALHVPITHAGTVLGTPVYMAPEQLTGQSVDARSDQYAFAATSYHLLYGELPFANDTLGVLLDAIGSDNVRRPTGRGEPAAARNALLRALRRDPSERFPSMAELLAEIVPAPRPPAISRRALMLMVAIGAGGLGAGLLIAGGDRASQRVVLAGDANTATQPGGVVSPNGASPDGASPDAAPPDAIPVRRPSSIRPRQRVPRRIARIGSHRNLWHNSEPMRLAAAPLNDRMSHCFDFDWIYTGGKTLLGVYLMVESDGRVSGVRVEDESYVPQTTKECIRRVYRRVRRFPAPIRGSRAEVWYAIPFRAEP